MTCESCGMPAQGRFCKICEQTQRLEDRHGVPADHMDTGDEVDGYCEYDEGELLDALREVADGFDEVPTAALYDATRSGDHPAASTLRNRFGGWPAAVEAAGLRRAEP